jgi:hypothetical protein
MRSFKDFYLTEAAGKNLHMEHIEDLVFQAGIDGIRSSIEFLRSVRDMLSGHSDSAMNITVKWDGAPAVFAGTNPENGKFFVGTKSVFNKRTPKINYTVADIKKNHSGDLAKKLIIALQELPNLGIKGVAQGDFLYSKSDLKTQKIDGIPHITFQPNTITYAIPSDSNLARIIKKSKMGVVFHTTYTGDTMESMTANFGFNANSLSHSSKVWAIDANFKDVSGSATLTQSETEKVTEYLSEIGTLFSQLNSKFVNLVNENEKLRIMIMTYNNTKVRKGKGIGNTSAHVRGLIKYIKERFDKEIAKLKTEKSQQKRVVELQAIEDFIISNARQFIIMFEIQKDMVQAKNILIRKLEKAKSIGTFIQTGNGFKVTAPEGFVAIDHIGNAVKLVDRMEFSRINFNIAKNWSS